MKKRALVLAGGGSRGSYQVGVWRALRELNWDFDIVTGTSVGALNGALAVQGDFDAAVQMWENISTTDILNLDVSDKIESFRDFNTKLTQFLGEMAKDGGADPRPLEEILRRCVDEAHIRQAHIDFAIVTVEYPSFTPRIIGKDNLPPGELVDYLMASAACFPAMKMRQIGATRYLDGGYYDNMPVQLAVERGAQEVVAVDLEAIGRRRKTPLPKGVRVRSIRSRWDLGLFILFDPATAQRNMRLGYLDALKAFGQLEGEAYAFYRGESEPQARRLEEAFLQVAKETGFTVQKYHMTALELGQNARLARVVRAGDTPHSPSPAAICAAAETAARVFALSPLDTYTFEALDTTLRERTAQIRTEEYAEVEQAIRSAKTPHAFLSAVKRIDRGFLAAFFCTQLAQPADILLPFIAAVAPDELIAALYLRALELTETHPAPQSQG